VRGGGWGGHFLIALVITDNKESEGFSNKFEKGSRWKSKRLLKAISI